MMSGRSTINFNTSDVTSDCLKAKVEIDNELQNSQASFDHWDKAREQSNIRWHSSKLEGYISDEFRSIEFSD
jgi:hypothetical protein